MKNLAPQLISMLTDRRGLAVVAVLMMWIALAAALPGWAADAPDVPTNASAAAAASNAPIADNASDATQSATARSGLSRWVTGLFFLVATLFIAYTAWRGKGCSMHQAALVATAPSLPAVASAASLAV